MRDREGGRLAFPQISRPPKALALSNFCGGLCIVPGYFLRSRDSGFGVGRVRALLLCWALYAAPLCSKLSHDFAPPVTKLPSESMSLLGSGSASCIGGNDAAGRNRSPHPRGDDVHSARQCHRRSCSWSRSCRTSRCVVRVAVRCRHLRCSKGHRWSRGLVHLRSCRRARTILNVGRCGSVLRLSSINHRQCLDAVNSPAVTQAGCLIASSISVSPPMRILQPFLKSAPPPVLCLAQPHHLVARRGERPLLLTLVRGSSNSR